MNFYQDNEEIMLTKAKEVDFFRNLQKKYPDDARNILIMQDVAFVPFKTYKKYKKKIKNYDGDI